MRCLFLSILTVLVICVNHAYSEDECINGTNKCVDGFMDIVYSAKTAEQFCQYYKTFAKCITLACPSLNGTLELPPEHQKHLEERMKTLGVNCDAPVGSQGEFHGITPAPGSKPGCIEKAKNCSRWYVNALQNSSVDNLCGNLHTFASCTTEACVVPMLINQTQIAKQFEDFGIQCDVSDLFQMAASTTPLPNGNQAAGSMTSSAGDRGDDPSNDSSCIISNARFLPLATLLFILRIFLS